MVEEHPFTQEEFLNAEQQMTKLVEAAARKYKVENNVFFANLKKRNRRNHKRAGLLVQGKIPMANAVRTRVLRYGTDGFWLLAHRCGAQRIPNVSRDSAPMRCDGSCRMGNKVNSPADKENI